MEQCVGLCILQGYSLTTREGMQRLLSLLMEVIA